MGGGAFAGVMVFWWRGGPLRLPGVLVWLGCQAAWVRWILSRLNAAAARCSSEVAAVRPRRENAGRIFLRLPMPGSTVAPRRSKDLRVRLEARTSP
jgi:hypothetical protein